MESLFDETVTVYRNGERLVVTSCRYTWEHREEESEEGVRHKSACRLFVPGEDYFPRVGDKIFPGIGPENGENLLPGLTPGVAQLAWVRPYRLFGELHHVEAGC